jgi:hypothetical protein
MSTLQAVHGTAPHPPCGEFDIEAVAEDGTRRKVPLASATRIPFADMTPIRRIKARKGQRHLPGRWWSGTDGRKSPSCDRIGMPPPRGRPQGGGS